MINIGFDRFGFIECVVGFLDYFEYFFVKRRNIAEIVFVFIEYYFYFSSIFDLGMKNTWLTL